MHSNTLSATAPKVLSSTQDASVNFVTESPDGGAFESRFVQRSSDYFIVYLSSHTGCNHSCRFCHLTATGQTMMTPASLDDFLAQAKPVLQHYEHLLQTGQTPANIVHFNFMARGEALSNEYLVNNAQELFDALAALTRPLGLDVKFKLSSIVPVDFKGSLQSVFADPRSMLYYSLYSLDPSFRKRWLPRAQNPFKVLDEIASLQSTTRNDVALHWAFIEGANDKESMVEEIVDAVISRGIDAKYNIVRYNPFSSRLGVEPSEELVNSLFEIIKKRTPCTANASVSRIVPRVGFDVKASCGMFVEL